MMQTANRHASVLFLRLKKIVKAAAIGVAFVALALSTVGGLVVVESRLALIHWMEKSGIAFEIETDAPQWLQRGDARYLRAFGRVTWIVVKSSEFNDSDLSRVCQLPSIRVLDLSSTRVTDAGLRHLALLPELRCLSLDETSITDVGLVELKRCGRLQEISLCRTRVTDAGVRIVRELPNLRGLYLNSTAISDLSLVELRSHSKLECVRVSSTEVTQEGRKAYLMAKGDRSLR